MTELEKFQVANRRLQQIGQRSESTSILRIKEAAGKDPKYSITAKMGSGSRMSSETGIQAIIPREDSVDAQFELIEKRKLFSGLPITFESATGRNIRAYT